MHSFKIGDYVQWHSPTRKGQIQGRIANFVGFKAYIITTTWDGRGHHWYVPLHRLEKVLLEA